MALYKAIQQDDGVTTSYHRIQQVVHTVNRQNSIVVFSYVNDECRNGEKDGTMAQPYQKAVTYELPYDPDMTAASAYDYLKTLPVFANAEDV